MEKYLLEENENKVEQVDFMNFETIEEFDSCESGFLAKKYFLLNWILS
ncbi:hypothetical protein ACIQZG_15975 [Lysinibacillus sp. NPDC096418]